MDRVIVYVDANPLDTDQLNQSKNTMIGLGMALQAILGTSTLFDGLACNPTGPASLDVLVGPGSIYSLQNVDNTAYGSVAADTAHQIVKQGINLGTLTLSCPAPGTTGQSINYLIQAAYQDTDTGATVLPYFNPDNPDVAFNGPDNLGTSQNTVRQGQCIVAVKAGVAATTGSQATPAPDAGYTGLWVVTVANGQTTITSGNISQVGGAPFIANKLTSLAPLASPALTGVPTVPTASPGTNTTQAASTAFVHTAVASSGTALQIANNLSDLGSISTALANIGFAFSDGTSGYIEIPNAATPAKPWIVQWGQFTTPSGSQGTLTFPITFPNNFRGISAVVQSTADNELTNFCTASPSTSSLQAGSSQFSGAWVARTWYWLAWGN